MLNNVAYMLILLNYDQMFNNYRALLIIFASLSVELIRTVVFLNKYGQVSSDGIK